MTRAHDARWTSQPRRAATGAAVNGAAGPGATSAARRTSIALGPSPASTELTPNQRPRSKLSRALMTARSLSASGSLTSVRSA
ncbi:hypothetical protein BE11_36845 [Sorangium cellulosum]|nr:hypothetical protein BE11_36845 [Sorangium cellulosum]